MRQEWKDLPVSQKFMSLTILGIWVGGSVLLALLLVWLAGFGLAGLIPGLLIQLCGMTGLVAGLLALILQIDEDTRMRK